MSKQKRKSAHSLMNATRRKTRVNAQRWLTSNKCSGWHGYNYCDSDTASGEDAGPPVALRSNQSSGLPAFTASASATGFDAVRLLEARMALFLSGLSCRKIIATA